MTACATTLERNSSLLSESKPPVGPTVTEALSSTTVIWWSPRPGGTGGGPAAGVGRHRDWGRLGTWCQCPSQPEYIQRVPGPSSGRATPAVPVTRTKRWHGGMVRVQTLQVRRGWPLAAAVPAQWKVALYDIIYDIITWSSWWYSLWYHMFWIVYDIIFLWYHTIYIYSMHDFISMISSYHCCVWYQ